MKKIVALVLSLAMMVAMVGCGGGNGATGDKVTLKIGVPGGNTLTPFELIDQFKAEHPEINVELEEAPWGEFKSKLKVQVGGGVAPDVFIMDSGYTATLGGLGAAADLSERIEKDLDADEYIGALFAAKDAEGHVWGVPHGMNSVGLYYNEQLFDDAGVEYPTEDWTFDDMIEAAKKLTSEPNATGASDVYGLMLGWSITNGWLPFILASGGTPLDETLTKSNFDDPNVIEGLKRFASLTAEGIAPPMPWVTSNGHLDACFYNGKAAMYIAQSSSAKAINANAPEGFRYNVQAMPKGWDGNRYTVYVPNSWVINSKSAPEVQDAAWEWLKFYLSEEAQLKLAETCLGGYPVNKKAVEYCGTLDVKPENREVFYKYIDETGVTLFENTTWEEWKPAADVHFKDLYNGVVTAEEAAQKIHKEVSEILAK